MAKSRTPPAVIVLDGANDVSMRFYVSDAKATPPNVPRLEVQFPLQSGAGFVVVDRPLSDYSTLSGANKTSLRNFLTTLRDETFTLEGYA